MHSESTLQAATAQIDEVRREIGKVIVGQRHVVDGVLICLLAGGHVLLEGVPGLGKTTLLRTLGRVLHLKYSRIQFTPDLMPADIVGSMMIETDDRGGKAFRFQPGPIFANLVLADEINRATPKTQSALLEAMQERTVTSGTTTHELDAPFLVMATQNPIEMEGTYPLPEAQLDRFLMKILVSYPSREDLNRIVERSVQRDEVSLEQVVGRDAILELRAACREVLVAPHVQDYAIDLVMATQPGTPETHELANKYIRYGSSPRGAQALVECGRVLAVMRSRLNLSIDDIREIAPSVLRHRIILNFDAHADGQTPDTLLSRIISGISSGAQVNPTPLIDSEFLEKLERLAIRWQKSFPGLVGGRNISHFAGPGQEFLDHRQFHHGDDLRAVNWRAYLRLEKLFLKMFQVEPRIPVRVLLDSSASMATGSVSKFDYARRLVAALSYVGLVRLDTICIQPFGQTLGDSFVCSGGRHRFIPAVNYLQSLKAGGRTNFFEIARQFLAKYPQRGLLIVISDFLDDADCDRPLQFLADFGHELMLVHLWSEEDREPPWDGQLDLVDAETEATFEIGFDPASRQKYTEAFDEHGRAMQRVALRNSGRYIGLTTSTTIEEAVFGSLARSGAIQ